MINPALLDEIVYDALKEDIGTGDITTSSVVPEGELLDGRFVAKSHGVIAGLAAIETVFNHLDENMEIDFSVEEGARVQPGDILSSIRGSAQSMLMGERVALNLLQRMSGIATRTAHFVELVAGTNARIVDTRKTTPGLRMLEKHAVVVGGGHNHRFGLYDAVMIKDNHIEAAGGIRPAVERARAAISHTATITVECESLVQVDEALDAGADILLLDNMTLELLAASVAKCKGRAKTEASGGVNENTVSAIARTGVDFISVGALTHSVTALDVSLDCTRIVP